MKLRSLVAIPICAQMGWSAITLTMMDPMNQPIAGVSCGQGGNNAVSNAQGVLTISGSIGILQPIKTPGGKSLFHLPLTTGEKAHLSIFDSRGHKLINREVRLGDRVDVVTIPGVYHVRVKGSDFTVSQSIVSMGHGLTFSGVAEGTSFGSGSSLRKAGAAAEIVCSKAGYATKTYNLNDGDTKTIGFGIPIGRAFDPTKYPKYPGYNLEVAEDFTTTQWPNGLTWDASYVSNDVVWEPSDGGFNDNAVRFHPSAISFKEDALVLRIDKTPQGSTFSKSEGDNCDPGAVGKTYYNDFCDTKKPLARTMTGGEIRTKNNHFRFGRYEITIDPPEKGTAAGQAEGFIAAMFTWRTPRDRNWRENDIEVLGNRADSYLTNIFYANKQYNWSANIGMPNEFTKPTGVTLNPRASNTYAFEWLPKTVKWYVNGQLVRTIGEGGEPLKQGMEISQLSTKVVMNFWIMGSGAVGGVGTNNGYPIEAKFDNFRYYRWDNDGDKAAYPEVECLSQASINCRLQ